MPPKKSETKTEAAAAPKSKSAGTHATYQDMITDAIIALKDRNGSSRQQLKKYVKANNNINTASDRMFDSLFNKALKAGVDKGIFEQPKGASGGTKLAKKAAKPAAPKKAAAPKKETKEKAEPKEKEPKEKKAAAPKKAAPPKKEAKEKKAPAEKKAATKKEPKEKVAAEKPAALTKTKSGRVQKTAAKPAAAKKASTAKKPTPKKKATKKADKPAEASAEEA